MKNQIKPKVIYVTKIDSTALKALSKRGYIVMLTGRRAS